MFGEVHVDDTLLGQSFALVVNEDGRLTDVDRPQVWDQRQVNWRTRLAQSGRRDRRRAKPIHQLLAGRTTGLCVRQRRLNELRESGEGLDGWDPLTLEILRRHYDFWTEGVFGAPREPRLHVERIDTLIRRDGDAQHSGARTASARPRAHLDVLARRERVLRQSPSAG